MTMDHRSTRAQDPALSDDDQGKPDWHNPVMEPRRPQKARGIAAPFGRDFIPLGGANRPGLRPPEPKRSRTGAAIDPVCAARRCLCPS